MIESATITLAELRRRFFPADDNNRRACALMREMRHVERGGDMWTTEGWLAEWMTAEALPAMNWPPKGAVYDPLEECVAARVIAIVRKLAEQGAIQVVGAPKAVAA